MQVIKPNALGLSTRPIEFKKRFGLCVSAYLHLPFFQDARGTLWAEQTMWSFLTREMGEPLIDEGVAKLTPEFLVSGKAFSPPDRPGACAVRARFAGKEKALLVFGERYWNAGRASEPEPFRELRLDWAVAYGGADFPANPAGRGRVSVDGVTWLPNAELPHDRLLRPDQSAAPAGFGALDIRHPARARYRGTYDADYQREHAPGFVPDTDWRYFNMAPADQWIEGSLRGDEAFSFENMHPDRALIEGRLPGFRARAFAGYKTGDVDPKIREIPLRLTTVWFFPHAERCVAIFQGLAEVETDDGSDIVSLLGAVERVDEPKSDAHYVDAVARRKDPKLGAIHAIVDTDLLPEGVSTADPDVEAAKEPLNMQGFQAEAQHRRVQIDVEIARDKVRAAGKDPDELGLKVPPREVVPQGDALPAYLEKKLKEAEAQQWAAVEDAVDLLEKALLASEQQKLDLAKLQHRGPPIYDAEKHLSEIRDLAARVKPQPDLTAVLPKLRQIEDAARKGYLQSAHKQPPAFAMAPAETAKWRDEVSRAIAAGIRMFAGMDFTGADFSGLDLRDANFEGAWLESVNFRQANLSGARFAGAVLAHANLEGVVALHSVFRGANLGRAQLTGGTFDDSDFSEAVLVACCFAGTQMRRAKFEKATLLETMWGEADWSGAELSGQTFYKADLKGMRWPEADLSACNFLESDLTSVDMRACKLNGATFVTCKLEGAKLLAAQCVGTVVVKDSTMARADMSQANLRGFNFGASDLRGARLVRAVLDGANLSEACLEGADLRLASAVGVLSRKTSFRSASLAGANLREAILQHADLRGADLRQSNLFGADLSRVRLDPATSFDGALATRTKTWPRLTPEQQAAAP